MNVLLDTHIVIWTIADHKFLTDLARAVITNPDNNIFYSAVSVIEVDWKTKSRHNNLELTVGQFIQKCRLSGFIPVALKDDHIAGSNNLIWEGEGAEHKDPFDRMLLAQAMAEDMMFMTHDEKISKFKQNCVILV